MRQILALLFLGALALTLGACTCKTCYVGSPGDCCKPCPVPLKRLTPPQPKKNCYPPIWPDRPVKCVTTQICRKCCHCECHKTEDGVPYQIEVCEITYKSLYTDGSSKIWTEVSRNPVVKGPNAENWKTRQPRRFSLVGNRCDGPPPSPDE